MLSIIIPTLNEENNLLELLKSIEKQNFKDYEIIIADAGSKDKTLEVAKKYNCKITSGGLPAKGKNQGAKIAQGDLLFFLDADVVLPKNVLGKILREFTKRKLKVAGFCLLPSSKSKLSKSIFTLFYNIPVLALEKILPHAAMGLLIEKNIFNELNGFDKTITLAEDHDLTRRAQKLGKYGILKSSKILVSDRRFRKDGWAKTYSKYLFCEGHMIFLGPVKSDIFEYKFGHYLKNKKNKL